MTKRKRVGYAKLGRSMQLNLANCSSLGGDNEMVPILKILAERHPDVDFTLIGRNSGEDPRDVGLPSNVTNPWRYWAGEIRKDLNRAGLNHPNYSIEEHIQVAAIIDQYTGPAIFDCDEIIMWLGQHGTANTPIPSIKDRGRLTKPYDWATLYCSYLINGINRWRDVNPYAREEVLLNADARNYVKYRDAKWPWHHHVFSQYTFTNNAKHERYGDTSGPVSNSGFYDVGTQSPGIWTSTVYNEYSRLELSSLLPGTPFANTVQYNGDWGGRESFGIVFNETRRDVAPQKARRTALRDWILPLKPAFIRGTWSAATLAELNLRIEPVPLSDYIPLLQSVRSTFTTPASGSGWATAKPWEAFAAGTVCFFHPLYDDQNNILSDASAELRDFLRVESPQELARRVKMVNDDEEIYRWTAQAQRDHFTAAVADIDRDPRSFLNTIERRLDLAYSN